MTLVEIRQVLNDHHYLGREWMPFASQAGMFFHGFDEHFNLIVLTDEQAREAAISLSELSLSP